VLAVRFAGGISNGDVTVRRPFHLGGAEPNANPSTWPAGDQLMRGFAIDTFAGSVSSDERRLRWPVARPQWGYGTWPGFSTPSMRPSSRTSVTAWTPRSTLAN